MTTEVTVCIAGDKLVRVKTSVSNVEQILKDGEEFKVNIRGEDKVSIIEVDDNAGWSENVVPPEEPASEVDEYEERKED